MAIQGLSDRRELPRGGTLRLGDEKSANRPGKQLGYFRFDPSDESLREPFRKLYGDEPRSVVVAFHSDDREEVFSDYYRLWKGQRVWCFGDNRRAWRLANLQTGQREEVECSAACPFRKTGDSQRNKDEGRDCGPEGWLRVLLPELPTLQLFDVTCRTVSIGWVSAVLDLLQGRWGCLRGIPLVLRLKEFKVRGMTNWGPCLDVRQSLIAQALGADPGRSLLGMAPQALHETQDGATTGDPPTAPPTPPAAPAPTAAPAPPAATPASLPVEPAQSDGPPGPQAAANGRSAGHGSDERNGRDFAHGAGRSRRNPHFTDEQRAVVRQLLAQRVFTDPERQAWTRRAQQVSSAQAAAQVVDGLRLEHGLRSCRALSHAQREQVRQAVRQADSGLDVSDLLQRLGATRTRPEVTALLERLTAVTQP